MTEEHTQTLSKLVKEYEDPQFPKGLLDLYNQTVDNEDGEEYYTILAQIFQSDKLHGTRLLDFGCGPTVHKVGPASRQFKEIILAEFSENNRKEVIKWLNSNPDALDWKPLLKMVAKAEGYTDLSKGIEEIEARIRSTVKRVVPCNLLADDILPSDIGEFDVVSSYFCIDGCCFTEEIYKAAIKKIAKYVKKGGAFIVESSLECTYYQSPNALDAIYLTESMIREAFKEAGFTITEWYYKKNVVFRNKADMTGSVIFVALKE